jgi:hypothetical protein
MPEVDACIDDIQHANYNIPELQHGHRKLVQRDRVSSSFGYEHVEEDYVDARAAKTYTQPNVEFNATLDQQQLACLGKINALLRRLVDGGSVSDKQLKSVLTAEQYEAYKESITAVMHSSEIKYGSGMPTELRRYQAKLKAADFQYNKFEKMSARARNGRARYKSSYISKGYDAAEKLYGDALECLEEIYNSADAYERYQLQLWMDRDLDFDAGAERTVGISPASIPRVRGSRSGNALDSGLPKLSKRLKRKECQLLALKDTAWALAFEQPVHVEPIDEVPTVRSEKLNKLLQLKEDDDY